MPDEAAPTLIPDQEQVLLQTWNKDPANPPTLAELCDAVFGPGFSDKPREIRAIKRALSKHNLKSRGYEPYQSKTEAIELSEAHKIFIVNNAPTMNPLEMARTIFANASLTNLHAEVRAVVQYIKSQNLGQIYNIKELEDVPEGEYTPPTTFDQALRRVVRYTNEGWVREKMTLTQRKCIERLIGYLHTYRFIAQMNAYENKSDRTLCEDAFIRYVYDKLDLTQEEVDQYIMLSNEVVRLAKIQRRSERLQVNLENIANQDEDNTKIAMGLVEAIGKAGNEYDQCLRQQQKLLSDLKETRSTRLSKQVRDNASIINLVQHWKTEEGRAEMLKHAEREQAAVKKGVEQLSSLPDLKARILGLVKEEIENG